MILYHVSEIIKHAWLFFAQRKGVFLNGKRTSCSYFPDARVMKDIRMKKRYYSDQALRNLQELNIDTATVTQILHTGDVDFGRSNTELDSCNLYLVTGTHMERDLACKGIIKDLYVCPET